MSSYLYSKLNSNSHEIRILEFCEDIRSRILLSKPRLKGWLQDVSLIDIKPYAALSYCWGEPASDKLLRLNEDGLNEDDMPITDNLHSALWALWKRRKQKTTIRVWVDAICINQDDFYERSQQVQMMRQIYSKAEEVIAWVGPVPGSILPPGDLRPFMAILQTSELGLRAAMQRAFFNEEYWKRVWIIQEITVASRVTMLYGDNEFSWDFLVVVLRSLLEYLSQTRTDRENEIAEVAASHILKFREHWMDSNKPITLFQAMTWTIHTKATDPRDKIFALLGLCHDGFRLVSVPNYKQSVESIVAEMSRLSFSHTRSLDLMSLRGTGEGKDDIDEYAGLPSWAPNWPTLWSSRRITAHEKMLFRSPTPVNYDPVLRGSTDSVLIVEGILVGEISAISSGLGTSTQERPSQRASKSWMFALEDLGRRTAVPYEFYRDKDLLRTLIWRTLTMNPSKSLGRDVDVEEKEIDDCFACLWTPQGRGSIYDTRIIDWLDENASFQVAGITLREWSQLEQYNMFGEAWGAPLKYLSGPPWPESGAGKAARIKAWEAANQALERVLGSGMRLAEWKSRKAGVEQLNFGVALVNPRTRIGDPIFALRGCSIPIILRRVGHLNQKIDTFEVVGALWTHNRLGENTYVKAWLEEKSCPALLGMPAQTLNLI